MYILADSAEIAFHKILMNLKNQGIETAPRGLKIKELVNCCVTITNPRDRIVSCPERKFNASYAFGELCWYLSGRNDLAMMEYYSKFMKKGTDDGTTLNSAYGYRIFKGEHEHITFNQWENVKRILKGDADSRQAIIHLHTPNNKKTNDEVCTLAMQFLIRDGKLDLIVTMRSNDLVLGFTYDVFSFTMLQEIMANELGVEVGTYYHNAGSMHIYENKFNLLKNSTISTLPPMEPFDFGLEGFTEMIEFEKYARGEIEDCPKCGVENNSLIAFAEAAFLNKREERDIFHSDEHQKDVVINNLDYLREINETYSDVLSLQTRLFRRDNKKIIIEGIDGAGKTTLANKIYKEDTGYCLQHYCKPTENFGYCDNYFFAATSDLNIIFDRFFPSEIVYSKYKNEHKFDNVDFTNLISGMNTEDVKFIFLIARDQEQINVINARLKPEDEVFKEFNVEQNETYIDLANQLMMLGFEVEIRGLDLTTGI